MTKEEQFYQALEEVFIGVPVEGESGYINLMRIKSRYYRNVVFPHLKKDIEEALIPFPDFRDELLLNYIPFSRDTFPKAVLFILTPRLLTRISTRQYNMALAIKSTTPEARSKWQT